ncbi:transglycosylase SLT domain-containing protein [Dokdonella koreensis]|uniref:Lytic murein transglycosylase n=1 Tax=Dokdonella koreensis DS-123 TaxID=1300342 RepID=A0A160DUF2_9GAMM|nr:transglycosylase SLT domain-containing protein [Dokdonella koreensis]ANB17690.1 Lytic murein transglycosylase [Dokdonella koreensis DS-123]
MILPIRISIVAALAVAAGCAGTSPRSGSSVPGKVNETGVDALYARLEADGRRYEAGLAAARDGETERARTETLAALDDLRAASALCSRTPGCERDRFDSTFDRLLRLHVDGLVDAEPIADGGSVGDAPGEPVPGPGESSPVVAALPELERSITLLKGRELAEVIAVNSTVKAAIEQWLTQYRPNLVAAYVNYQYMRYRMWPEYHKAGLPEAVLFGIMAKESGGKVHAVSRSGASGPLQFMYATGLRFGMTTVDGFDQRFDPGLSARANAAYINEQLAALNNNLELVLAAYNGGEGRMRRLAGGSPSASFWDPKLYATLPVETRDYVPMVLAAAWLFLHPDRYNLEFPRIDGRPGEIVLKHPASINELTVCLGQSGGAPEGWFRTLRNLNPRFDPQQRQPPGTRLEVPVQLEAVYAASCETGPWRTLAGELRDAAVPARAVAAAARETARATARTQQRNYTVRKGDTLAAIARRTGCGTPGDIARANGIRPPHYAIRAGQTLQLPGCSSR